MKVALIVDDTSRPTPVETLLPPVLAELERAGMVIKDLTLVPALGVHRPSSLLMTICPPPSRRPGAVFRDLPPC